MLASSAAMPALEVSSSSISLASTGSTGPPRAGRCTAWGAAAGQRRGQRLDRLAHQAQLLDDLAERRLVDRTAVLPDARPTPGQRPARPLSRRRTRAGAVEKARGQGIVHLADPLGGPREALAHRRDGVQQLARQPLLDGIRDRDVEMAAEPPQQHALVAHLRQLDDAEIFRRHRHQTLLQGRAQRIEPLAEAIELRLLARRVDDRRAQPGDRGHELEGRGGRAGARSAPCAS